MKAKEIQDLIDFIAKLGLDEVNIETDQFKLNVKKNALSNTPVISASPQPPQVIPSPAGSPPEEGKTTPEAAAAPAPSESNNYVTVKSPMIGTFYRAANPESDPFVKVGDGISAGQPVCIIEAMKLFNEIESEVSGKVVKVLVENASPVEYDQDLFLVDPS